MPKNLHREIGMHLLLHFVSSSSHSSDSVIFALLFLSYLNLSCFYCKVLELVHSQYGLQGNFDGYFGCGLETSLNVVQFEYVVGTGQFNLSMFWFVQLRQGAFKT
ncbi:hypothetical protein RYX36_006705 [Vicia faba]